MPQTTPVPPKSCSAESITCCADSVANSFAIAASRVMRPLVLSFAQAAR